MFTQLAAEMKRLDDPVASLTVAHPQPANWSPPPADPKPAAKGGKKKS